MLVTEADAVKKWCPHARTFDAGKLGDSPEQSPVVVVANRGGSGHVNCYGSACMAWRWADGGDPFHVSTSILAEWQSRGYEVIKDEGPRALIALPQGKRQGYCGQAGAP